MSSCLKKRLAKAEKALEDIANGDDPQCLVAQLGASTKECRAEKLCLACKADRVVNKDKVQ